MNKVINNYCCDEQLRLNQKFYCSKQLKVNQKFYCNKQLKVNQKFYCNNQCTKLNKEKDYLLQQSWINHLFKREIRTAWCQQPSEREEADKGESLRSGHLYRQARTSLRCWVLPPGGSYGCKIPTLLLKHIKTQYWLGKNYQV